MRIVGVTQGSGLDLFLNLLAQLEAAGDVTGAGAFVADSAYFQKAAQVHTRLVDHSLDLLKEWEVVGEGLRASEDTALISAYEREVSEPAWYALLADRRLFFGRYSKRIQDYRPHLTEMQMRGVLTVMLRRIDQFLEQSRPDVILAFGTATLGDYLFGRIAKARGLCYLQLKATKIKNYVSLNDEMIGLSGHISRRFEAGAVSEQALEIAREYLESVRKQGVKYEGAIRLDSKFKNFALRRVLGNILRSAVLELRRWNNPTVRHDNHLDGFFRPALLEGGLQHLRAKQFRRAFGKCLIGADALATRGRFAFFPLHFEPEVSIQVFGRPYQNQIEVVRALALALPADVQLLVKEHPRSIGFRPVGYYRKLLEIPNVRLVDPRLPSVKVVANADLVAVISGTIGLEAAILNKPVLAFGRPTYCALPDEIVTKVTDLWRLPDQVHEALTRPPIDTEPILRLLAAHIDGAVGVDLYTALLGKPGRYHEGEHDRPDQRQTEHLRRLVTYVQARLAEEIGASGVEGRHPL